MPYIDKIDREYYDSSIDALILKLRSATPGVLNYVISRIVWAQFKDHPTYTEGNELMGVLQCVSAEFYRRKLAPYEDTKIVQNGDLKEA